MAQLLVRMTSAPYSTSNAGDGLDFAMAATNYGHDVTLLFEGHGIYQLLPQSPHILGVKNHYKRLKALPFFDVEACFYASADQVHYQIDENALLDTVAPIDDTAILSLIESADHVVTF